MNGFSKIEYQKNFVQTFHEIKITLLRVLMSQIFTSPLIFDVDGLIFFK